MKGNFEVFGNWKKLGIMREVDGEPWFVGSMVATMFGYGLNTDIPALFKDVPDEWKDVKPVPNPEGKPEAFCLSEQGLYDFILNSDRPQAREFQRMVYEIVLPSIYKFGAYLNDEFIDEILENSDRIVESIKEQKEEAQRIAEES
jgi:anti-repressor protein